MTTTRADGRRADELRPLSFALDFTCHAAGSVLVSAGDTRVLCTASIENRVPRWLSKSGEGWLTAEYGMLPGATHTRSRRDGGRPGGRTQEIQRLIGRSLRACLDRSLLGERTITIDCDVIQADGGTRTASITGGFVALALACARLIEAGDLDALPLIRTISAVSCGVIDGLPCLDLPYEEDSRADVDMNLVTTGAGEIVEIQATGEGGVLPRVGLDRLIDLGVAGCNQLTLAQRDALARYDVLAPLFQHLTSNA